MPAPGPDTGSRDLPIEVVPAGSWCCRFQRVDAASWFGPPAGEPPKHRFDDPWSGDPSVAGSLYQVGYFGLTFAASFIETLVRNPGRRLVSLAEIEARTLLPFTVTRPLRLVRFHGEELLPLGLDATEAFGPYALCQAWSRAFNTHLSKPDGIEFRSRLDPTRLNIALYDRARDALALAVPETLDPNGPRASDLKECIGRYRVTLTA